MIRNGCFKEKVGVAPIQKKLSKLAVCNVGKIYKRLSKKCKSNGE